METRETGPPGMDVRETEVPDRLDPRPRVPNIPSITMFEKAMSSTRVASFPQSFPLILGRWTAIPLWDLVMTRFEKVQWRMIPSLVHPIRMQQA